MNQMKKVKSLLVLAFLTIIVMSGCIDSNTTNNKNEKETDGNSNPGPETSSVIDVALLAPLSGGMAVTGEMIKHGVELATEEYNMSNQLPNNATINLNIIDDRATPSEGVTAAQRLVNDGKTSAVLGPYNSSVALAVKDIFTEGELPFLSHGTAADAMTEGNVDWYFRPHAYNQYQSEAFADFVFNKLKKKKVAILYENTDWGQGLSSNVTALLEEMGAEILASEGYNPGTRDFSSALTKINSLKPEAIVTMALGTESSIIAKQAMEHGISGDSIIGVGGFDHPDFYKLSAGGAEDINFMFWFDANNQLVPEGRKFADAFIEKFGSEPDSAAAQAYTAAKVLYEAIIKSGSSDKEEIRNALIETDLSGPIGDITFDENHNAQTGIYFAQWKNGEKEYLNFK